MTDFDLPNVFRDIVRLLLTNDFSIEKHQDGRPYFIVGYDAWKAQQRGEPGQ